MTNKKRMSSSAGKIALLSLVVFMASISAIIQNAQGETIVIAHRGNSSEAPENTLSSFRSAASLKPAPSYVELDLHRSKDGVLIVSHDDDAFRTTSVPGMIREQTFTELRKLDAGYSKVFGEKYKGEKIPRFEEVLEAVKGTGVGIMIECKQLLLEDAVVDLLRRRGELDNHVIASFDELTVYRAKKLEPAAKTLYLTDSLSNTYIWRAKDLGADIIGANNKSDPKDIEKAHKEGFKVWVWTIDDEETMQKFIDAGADGIITNKPAFALQVVKKANR
ncbi:MAG: glycerophosphodiester phosphodiesterase family protein [Candidatus Omnitrophota bacterium]